MKTGYVHITGELLREFLMMPQGWKVVSVQWDVATQIVEVAVMGENVPAGFENEFLGEFMRHRDDITGEVSTSVRWKPATDPGPMTYMGMAGTTKCFWCKREANEHLGKVCPIQPAKLA